MIFTHCSYAFPFKLTWWCHEMRSLISRTAFLTLFPAQFYRNKWHLVQARGLGAIGLQSQSKVSPYILGEVIAV